MWKTISTPKKGAEKDDVELPSLGGPFPIPPAERRIQPPRKRRRPKWYSYIESAGKQRAGRFANKNEKIPKGGILKVVGKMPEK